MVASEATFQIAAFLSLHLACHFQIVYNVNNRNFKIVASEATTNSEESL